MIAAQGKDRVQAVRIAGPDGERSLAVDVVALNLGFQPETGLARALGIPHRFVDVGLGHLATETDSDGRTAVASVFAVGDGAMLGGSRVALARGRLAGLAAARDLGLAFQSPHIVQTVDPRHGGNHSLHARNRANIPASPYGSGD